MASPRIYTDQPLTCGTSVTLEPGASHHLSTVLRLKAGDGLRLFNGLGGEYSAQIKHCSKRQVQVLVQSFYQPAVESPLQIELGMAISKGDRFEWALQKAVELGVTSLTPLISERVQGARNQERLQKKQQQWQAIAISACEQSGRTLIPNIASATALADWLPQCQQSTRLILHTADGQADLPDPAAALATDHSVALAIGPEGGWTEAEVAQAQAHGFAIWQIGNRILRTETAPLVAVTLCQQRWGDFRP